MSGIRELDEETVVENAEELYGVRNTTLFLVDASPPMFENDPKEGVPYFLQCIKQYKEILRQKLVWRSQDWIGLMFFGTDEWDEDPKVEHVLTVQKLNILSVEKLKEIIDIENGKWEYYRDIASSTSYPLYDALWHAMQSFSAIKLPMPVKKLILFTCRDNPPITDQNELHRIRVRAADFTLIKLELAVVGLGPNWNPETFYKDLEMLSKKIDAEDYKRTSLKDVVEQVKMPSRIAANLPLRLGGNVTVDVCLRNYTVPTEYLKWVTISKALNVPLRKITYRRKVGDDSEEEDDTENFLESIVLEIDVQKYQEYGNRKISFSLDEVKYMGVQRKPGIDIICAKPCSYHPLDHSRAPYFLTHHKSYRKDNKLLFAALVDRCKSKDIMLICAVTLREYAKSKLYCMIPNPDSGSFYLYNIPFAEHVRSTDHLEKFKFNKENPPPVDPEELELMTKIIKKLRIVYDPKIFPNPKLQVQRQTIEALAVDLEEPEPPIDRTLPDINAMRRVAGDLFDAYEEKFGDQYQEPVENASTSRKKFKPNDQFYDANSIRNIIQKGELGLFTVAQLKEILRHHHLKVTGTKAELIKRMVKHFKP